MAKKNSRRRFSSTVPQTGNGLPADQLGAFDSAYRGGNYQRALQLAEAMVQRHPQVALAHELNANALGRLERFSEASDAMTKVVELVEAPGVTQQLKLAQYHVLAGRAEAAVTVLEGVANAEPTHMRVLVWLSRAYHQLGNNRRALEINDRALAVDAHHEEALLWRARILDQLKHHDDALEILELLLAVNPQHIGVHNHIATLYVKEGDYQKAEEHFSKELDLDSTNGQVHSNLLMAAHYNPEYSAKDIFSKALEWDKRFAKVSLLGRAKTLRDPAKRLRIGLLSGGFRVHPVGQMILPALRDLSATQFELIAYSTNQFSDTLTHEFKKVVNEWKVVEGLSESQLDQKIRDDGIDILIDLNGAGEGSCYETLTRMPAPLIVKWVGNLINTTGLSCFDYLLSDGIETPEGVDDLYVEKLIRLPDDYICYHIPEHAPSCNALPALNNGYITFGCLNNPAKLSPPMLAEWAKLLKEVPESKLLMRGIQFESARYRSKITRILAQHGIAEERLIMEGPAQHQEFLATYQRIDIALDTWPYSGGLTTCEALMMGVPVVTRVGPTFAGRHSATHLVNTGLPELVTDNWDDFRSRAKELASDLPNLAVIRAALRTILTNSPVCDGSRFGNHLAMALRAIWQRHCEGKTPEALTFHKEGEAKFADEAEPVVFFNTNRKQLKDSIWSEQEPIIVVDNGALMPRHERFRELLGSGNVAVISFDPGSLFTKQSDELRKLGEWHHHAHVSLGSGVERKLYVTLDPEESGTLKPLLAGSLSENSKGLQVLTELPINTLRLDDIEGLPCVDMLLLDGNSEVLEVLQHGKEYLKKTLLIQVVLPNNAARVGGENVDSLKLWAVNNGFHAKLIYSDSERKILLMSAHWADSLPEESFHRKKKEFLINFFEANETIDGFERLRRSLKGRELVFLKTGDMANFGVVQKGQDAFIAKLVEKGVGARAFDVSSNGMNEEFVRLVADPGNIFVASNRYYDACLQSSGLAPKNLYEIYNKPLVGSIGDHPYATFMTQRMRHAASHMLLIGSPSLVEEARFLRPDMPYMMAVQRNTMPEGGLSVDDVDHSKRDIDLLVPMNLAYACVWREKYNNLLDAAKRRGKKFHDIVKTVIEEYTNFSTSLFEKFLKTYEDIAEEKWKVSLPWSEKDVLLMSLLGSIDDIVRGRARAQALQKLGGLSKNLNVVVLQDENTKAALGREVSNTAHMQFVGVKSSESMPALYQRSKLVLHVNPTYHDSLHERFVHAVNNGCGVLSNENMTMLDHFRHKESVIYYNGLKSGELEEVDSEKMARNALRQTKSLLGDEYGAQRAGVIATYLDTLDRARS
ncbi:MAG: O-linked N-acetylglucosamine transferase, SPINDLY family protein [Halomonadaceae bacterium]|jgi:protein O-GlcNAc transferase